MKNTQSRATKALKHFKQIKRTSGKQIWITEDAPQWLTDLCREAHGDKMPDDYVYEFIYESLCAISDASDLNDVVELEADTYTNELTAWLHSRADRTYYLTEALQEYGSKDGFQALQTAQYLEKMEILNSVKNSLERGK